MPTKEVVRQHWEAETAGTRYGEGGNLEAFHRSMEQWRYFLEPYIPSFADFESYAGKRILEIGVGAGVDFSQFVRHGASATGVDLTEAAITHTTSRLKAVNNDKESYRLAQADAENLPFKNNTFDLVYSWGALHHTPDTATAFKEALRVLKPAGALKAMIYHTPSWTGCILWFRHGFLAARPWVAPRRCIYEHLESPGTKAYTVAEAEAMLAKAGFTNVRIRTKLGPGDLLTIKPSQKYQGQAYRLVWALYPRWLVRRLGDRFGLYLLVTAEKPA
ncbi:MAG: class I SAM-dependent methyltransferase [Candidatus Methylomirabilales bacterium]